jgi:hypothetical protein
MRGWHARVPPIDLFDRAEQPSHSDFGVAKALGSVETIITMAGTTPGTSLSMAPEARKSRRLSRASDQYALGVILSDLLACFPPPEADTPVALLVKRQTGAPAHLSERAPGVPEAAAEAVIRVLSRGPEDRFPRCLAFAAVFAAGLSGEAVPGDEGTDGDTISGKAAAGSEPSGPKQETRTRVSPRPRASRKRRSATGRPGCASQRRVRPPQATGPLARPRPGVRSRRPRA